MSLRNTCKSPVTQQQKARSDLPSSYWAAPTQIPPRTNDFVYSTRGAFVRLSPAVHLHFCWGSLEESITVCVVMDGFNQGLGLCVSRFLSV